MSWEVSGSHFITRAHRNPTSKIYNQIINQWIGEANLQEREALTNDLFNAFAASGATKITELNKNGFGGFGAILSLLLIHLEEHDLFSEVYGKPSGAVLKQLI